MECGRFNIGKNPKAGIRNVEQTFLSAGSGDFPIACFDTGLESPVNRQAGKPALRFGLRLSNLVYSSSSAATG
jgi:hypothetical protein